MLLQNVWTGNKLVVEGDESSAGTEDGRGMRYLSTSEFIPIAQRTPERVPLATVVI